MPPDTGDVQNAMSVVTGHHDPALDALAVPDLDAPFRMAQRLDHDSAWFGHVPFAHWLIRATQPGMLVELGTHAGISYTAFCQAVQTEELGTRCYAVDTWEGDQHTGQYGEEVFSELRDYHDARFLAFSQLLRCSFDEALDHFPDGSVDLLHIDGLHTYEAVKRDFENWTPKLSSRAVVLFHDTGERLRGFGVWRLWREIASRNISFEFTHGHGLGVLCAGVDAPARIRALCELPEREAALVRARFAFLGSRWETEARAINLHRDVAARNTHIVGLEQALTETAARAAAAEQDAARAREIGDRADAERAAMAARAQADQAALTARLVAAERTVRMTEELAKAADLSRLKMALLQNDHTAEIRVAGDQADVLAQERHARAAAEHLAVSLRAEAVSLRAEAEHERAARVAAEASGAEALRQRDALAQSTIWHATWPIRWTASVLPPAMRRPLRRTMQVVWWAATPWNMRRRLAPASILPAPQTQALLAVPPAVLPEPAPAGRQADENPDAYARWIADIEAVGRPSVANVAASLSFGEVRFSILMPAADLPDAAIGTLNSLLTQFNTDWELLLPDPGPTAPNHPFWAAGADRRVVRVANAARQAERGATLAALLAAARGAWIAVLDPGDRLASDALLEIALALADRPDSAILYGDEDELRPDGRRAAPQFKPSWSPELLQAYNYFGRLTMISRDLALEAGGFVAGHGAGAEWSLHLRAAEAADAAGRSIGRVPRVLCHGASGNRRDRPPPASVAAAQHRRVLHDFWLSRGIVAPWIETQPDGTQRTGWEITDPPLVSIIIPNHNSPTLLRRCVEDILDRTDYPNLEIIIVENNSNDPQIWTLYEELERRSVRVLRQDGFFNYSAACNKGAEIANGSLLLFLNNDIQTIDRGWLAELVRVALLPGVGVVGTKLRYPSGALQHGGVGVGVHLFGLMFHQASEHIWGVFGSPNHMRNWSAVMGACQMVTRAAFDRAGGFDDSYQIANSDVALCLNVLRSGLRIVYTPFAALVHHEGTTRGRTNPNGDMGRGARDVLRLGIDEDPYLHPELSGLDPVPRLRTLGEPALREVLRQDADRWLAMLPAADVPLDLFSDAEVAQAAGLPRSMVLWPTQSPTLIQDRWSAARWLIDLLRRRADLRARFPFALSEKETGAFADWLDNEAENLALSADAVRLVHDALAADINARPRQVYFRRSDLRSTFPLGLLPTGRRGLLVWLLRNGRIEEDLRLEEIWWFALGCAEDPPRELVRSYRFTPEWQQRHPDGLTVFGRDRFAAWLAGRYRLSSDLAWIRPELWPEDMSPAMQLRLAYAARPNWRLAQPRSFESPESATQLLNWLASSAAPHLSPQLRRWCHERSGDGTAHSLAAPGVNVIAHFCYPSGLRVSAEAMSEAMEQAGIAISRRDLRTDKRDDPQHSDYDGLECYDITILHTQPEPFFDQAYALADLAERSPRPYRIAYWYWELDIVPDYWAEKARNMDEIWAATSFVADALRRTIPLPVHTLFPGVRIAPFTPRARQTFGIPGGERERFAFLFSFHIGSVMERKNPLGLIRAFKQAFRSDEPVDLILKTTSLNDHGGQLRDLHMAAANANIIIIDRIMTADETMALMASCDAYVSLHRSEGLGLTMAEAMLLGKPVIATRHSGNLEFMDDNNSLLVDNEIVAIGRPVPPYDATAHWAEPSIAHASRLMRQLYEHPAMAKDLGARGQAAARERLSPELAGRRFAARITEIRAEQRRRADGSAWVE